MDNPLLFPTETIPMATPKRVQKKNSRSRFWAFIIVIVIAFSLLLFLRTSTTSPTAGHTCGPHTELIGNECVGEDTTALIAAKEAAVTDKLAAVADKEAAEAAKEALIAAKEAAVTDKLAAVADKEAAEAAKEATLAVIDVAIADKEAAIVTSMSHLNDKEAAEAARDTAQAARDAAIAEKEAAAIAKDAAEAAKATALITKAAAEDARDAAQAAKDAAEAARDECLAASEPPYQPCAQKSEGDDCLLCAPGDSECAETMVVKTCQDVGSSNLVCSPLSSGAFKPADSAALKTAVNECFLEGNPDGSCTSNGAIGDWDVSLVTNMDNLFDGKAVFNQDLSKWDTSSVTSMNFMFGGCSVFNHDLSKWDTGAVTSMSYTFLNAYAFNQDLSSWDTSKVTTFKNMFYQAYAFNSDVSAWDTSSATIMSMMFFRASAFNSDVSAWDTSKVTTMEAMFEDSGYAGTFCGGTWESLSGANSAFTALGTSTARIQCSSDSGDNGGVAFDISTHGTIGAVCDYIDDNVGGYQCTSMDLILEEGSILTGQAAKDACDTIAAKITAVTAADETMPDWIANECKAGHAEEDFSKCMCVVQWSDSSSSDPDGALYTGALFDSVTNFNAGWGIPQNCNNWLARGRNRSCVTTTP